MSTLYAQAQAVAGAAVVQLLANATLTVGASTVDGHLNRNDVIEGEGGVQTIGITFTCISADLAALTVSDGTAVSIDGTAYTVRRRSDGGGAAQTQLVLART